MRVTNRKCTGVMVLAAASLVGACLGVSAKKTQIMVWDWSKERMDNLKPKVAEYEKRNPNLEFKLSLADWGSYPDKILASVIGGNPPDIVLFHNAWTSRLLKVLAPFPPERFQSSKMASEYFMFNTAFRMNDGRFYFFPDGLMTSAIFYNKTMWAQAGLSSTPRSWDEMRLAARKLTKFDGTKMSVGGFSFPPSLLFDDLNYQLGGGLYNDAHTGVAWNTDEGRKAISLIGTMALSDNIRPTSGTFETNKVAMLYNWTWLKASLLKISPQKLQWSAFTLPTFNGGDTDIRGRNNYESGYAVPANLKGNRKDEAFKFLAWLYSDDAWYVKLNDMMGRLPGKKSLWTRREITDDLVGSVLAKQMPYTIFPGERPSWIDEILGVMEGDILNKKLSPLDALRKAQTNADKQWKVQAPKWIVERRIPKG